MARKQRRTLALKELHRLARQDARAGIAAPEDDYWRPKTRADCFTFERPCPFIACRYHLFLDRMPNGSIRLPFLEDVNALENMPSTCTLDVADEQGKTLDEVGTMTALTRERVRQIERRALAKLRGMWEGHEQDFVDEYDETLERLPSEAVAGNLRQPVVVARGVPETLPLFTPEIVLRPAPKRVLRPPKRKRRRYRQGRLAGISD